MVKFNATWDGFVPNNIYKVLWKSRRKKKIASRRRKKKGWNESIWRLGLPKQSRWRYANRGFINLRKRTWLRGSDGSDDRPAIRPPNRNSRRFPPLWRCRGGSTLRFSRYRGTWRRIISSRLCRIRSGWCRRGYYGEFFVCKNRNVLGGIRHLWRKGRTSFLLWIAGDVFRWSGKCWKTWNTRIAWPSNIIQRWSKCWFRDIKPCTSQNLDTLALLQRFCGSGVSKRHRCYIRRRAECGWRIANWTLWTFYCDLADFHQLHTPIPWQAPFDKAFARRWNLADFGVA